MKSLICLLIVSVSLTVALQAKDNVPRGCQPLAEFKVAQAKGNGKKLVVLVVKGMNDSCPNCAAAMENGFKALGSGVIKLFARAETIRNGDLSAYPPKVQERIQGGFSTGASVAFVVFNPDCSAIVAEAGRNELQSDHNAIAAFKQKVQEAKKAAR